MTSFSTSLKIAGVILAALVINFTCAAQSLAPENTIKWESVLSQGENGISTLVFTGKIVPGWHTYGLDHEFSATEVNIEESSAYAVVDKAYEISAPDEFEGEKVFFKEIKLGVDIKVKDINVPVKGYIRWQSCDNNTCASPEYWNFSIGNDAMKDGGIATSTAQTSENNKTKGFDWGLILSAILWGFAMLLTPCVFPMVPMTVSFFMKGSSTPAAGRFKASMYGLFIVLLYTVPISLIIFITWIVGGDAVTADIFNWLATHWLPNIIFFIVFMIFAASFFGAFEITLPSSLVNKSDKGADKGGLAGIFFMALTLVLVSFSCTGPIVGTVLIQSTQGEFWAPMVTMLAFSVAFALPFTLFAMFPSLLQKFKRGGGSWLNSVKVVLGFIEVALGFKFLSVADQTYHWGLLDREVYLAIWIVVFALLGLYLLGKIRFANDEKVESISVTRLALAIGVFTFVVYLIPGMFGAPLKALSGYLPPISTQDFVIGQGTTGQTGKTGTANEYGLHLPHNLSGYFDLDAGLEEAKKQNKPVFLDITGHGCVNCREMESRVWSDPRVLEILDKEYIIVALYTDDKQKLPEDQWVTTENGDILKDLGRINSYIARTRFGVNAQPNYILLSPKGEQLVPTRGYNLDVEGFISFLQSGLNKLQ